ncbi:hypothetical protein [uncultured Oscillibacter sp.]|uniref:hypothetical protein n=1 Tax=uncultured Oscillibacter sp. TaxID=876091 RepID=UPI0026269534|nr:hypothetical protein [uncultured Oscillibacter sp.]
MKKVVAAMAAMFVVLVPLVGLWGILLKRSWSVVQNKALFTHQYRVNSRSRTNCRECSGFLRRNQKLREEIKNINEKQQNDEQEGP